MTFGNDANMSLAVLDVEGVIIPKRRYLLLQAVKKLSFLKFLSVMALGFLYEIGFISLEKALTKIYLLLKGVSKEELYRTFKSIPIIVGVQQVFQKLKENGFQIALISSGIPDFLVEELAKQFGADYAQGLKLEIINDKFTGKIHGDVLKPNGKGIVLEKILKEENYSKYNCIIVADDRNNIPMIPFSSRTIGYNPDIFLSYKCDYAVKGSMQDVIPFLDTPVRNLRSTYTRNDVFRQAIHMGSFLIPVICQFFRINRYAIATLILATTIAYTFSELKRRTGISFPLFEKITNLAITEEEKNKITTSPIYFAIGIMIPLIFYPPQIGFTAITILTLGDGTAEVVGNKLGKTIVPYNKAKKIEGIIAGILVAASASILFMAPIRAFAASTISMMVESLPSPIDDNISIPLVAGLTLTIIS